MFSPPLEPPLLGTKGLISLDGNAALSLEGLKASALADLEGTFTIPAITPGSLFFFILNP